MRDHRAVAVATSGWSNSTILRTVPKKWHAFLPPPKPRMASSRQAERIESDPDRARISGPRHLQMLSLQRFSPFADRSPSPGPGPLAVARTAVDLPGECAFRHAASTSRLCSRRGSVWAGAPRSSPGICCPSGDSNVAPHRAVLASRFPPCAFGVASASGFGARRSEVLTTRVPLSSFEIAAPLGLSNLVSVTGSIQASCIPSKPGFARPSRSFRRGLVATGKTSRLRFPDHGLSVPR